jgi:hypothetical protein
MNGLASDVSLGANANEEEDPVENAVLEEARGAVKASQVEAKRAMVATAENFMMVVLLLLLSLRLQRVRIFEL